MLPSHSWDPSQGFPISTGGEPGFLSNLQCMQPPYQIDNYYPSAELPFDQQHYHHGPPYGTETAGGMSSPSVQPEQSIINKVIISYLYFFLNYLFFILQSEKDTDKEVKKGEY